MRNSVRTQIHMRAINGSLSEAKVGSKHHLVFLEFAADLLEECLDYVAVCLSAAG